MGKTYKKVNVCHSGVNKTTKKFYNRKLRRTPIDGEFASGNWFKKKNCPWDIVDWKMYYAPGERGLQKFIKDEQERYKFNVERYDRFLKNWEERGCYSFPKPHKPSLGELLGIWRVKDTVERYPGFQRPEFLKKADHWRYELRQSSTFEEFEYRAYERYEKDLQKHLEWDGVKKNWTKPVKPKELNINDLKREFYKLYRNK